MDILTDVCRDCVIDTVKIIPFLYLMYLLMEYLEHSAGEKTIAMIRRADRVGPLWGRLLFRRGHHGGHADRGVSLHIGRNASDHALGEGTHWDHWPRSFV